MPTRRLLWGLSATLLVTTPGVAQTAAPAQPIPFSHKVHTAQQIKCADCHPIRDPGFQAGYPKESACMACHATVKTESPAIRKLAEYAKTRQPIPWVKIYKIPDFVWFSHASHAQEAKIACADCHGPVASRDVLAKERPTDMASCMDCHSRRAVSNACDFCHSMR